MPVTARSFAKVNLGLAIGPLRSDGFHFLHTIYHTIALHDRVTVEVARGSGIEIVCKNPAVPAGPENTCYRIVDLALSALGKRAKVKITILKRLPLQGGMGGASSNAAVTLLALEKAVGIELHFEQKLEIASQVGSDVPLFLLGGAVAGFERGEKVIPLTDKPSVACVVVTPEVGVSTPAAFRAWDEYRAYSKLTEKADSTKLNRFSQTLLRWLSGTASGVPARGRNRAEAKLLDLVRTGIQNDFERVVFPIHPELKKVKAALVRHGARYASLSGSGATVFGLFASGKAAEIAARKLSAAGWHALATETLPRREYLRKLFAR